MIDLQFRVLSNIDGIYLTEENCKLELLDTLSDEEKSSVFWLSFTDKSGYKNETEKRVWIQHFHVDKETNTGKCDFKYKNRLLEYPYIELRDWLINDIILELWETRPQIKEKHNEDGTTVKEVVLGDNLRPIID